MAKKRKRPPGSTREAQPGKPPSLSRSDIASVTQDLPELQRARALWVQQRLVAALVLFERAVQSHPNNAIALADAARAFGSMYQYRRAEQLLARLETLAAATPALWHLAAQSYRIVRRPTDARRCFEAALKQTPANRQEARLELALLEERDNELEPALAHVDALLAARRQDSEGRVVKARILRRRGDFQAAEALLRAVLQQRDVHWMTLSRAWAELAALFDRQGAFGEAWDAMLSGKQTLRRHAAPAQQHRDRLVPPLERLVHAVDGAHYVRWGTAAGPDDQPRTALLTGLPRSGTTLLAKMLGAHSRVTMADEFDAFPRLIFPLLLNGGPPETATVDYLDQLPSEAVAGHRRNYQLFLAEATQAPAECNLILDKNPSLLPMIPPYLRVSPHSPLVVALRDPRDVLVSCLFAYLPLNDFSVDFLQLESAVDRLTLDLGLWLDLRERLPPQWTEVRYEDVVRDPASAARRCIARLNLEWEEEILQLQDAPPKQPIFSPSYDAVSEPLHGRAVGRWKNYAHFLGPVLDKLAATAARLGYSEA